MLQKGKYAFFLVIITLKHRSKSQFSTSYVLYILFIGFILYAAVKKRLRSKRVLKHKNAGLFCVRRAATHL